jgi:hypothetical protein
VGDGVDFHPQPITILGCGPICSQFACNLYPLYAGLRYQAWQTIAHNRAGRWHGQAPIASLNNL